MQRAGGDPGDCGGARSGGVDKQTHRDEVSSSVFGGFSGGDSSLRFNGLPIIYHICWDVWVQAIGSLWGLRYTGLTKDVFSVNFSLE